MTIETELNYKALDAAMDGADDAYLAEGDDNLAFKKAVLTAIKTYLAAVETELPAVKVKALEWQHEDDGEYIAQSETGWYHIGRPASFWNLTIPSGGVPSFETLEAAKAAAQADYERRILSALVPSDALKELGKGDGR